MSIPDVNEMATLEAMVDRHGLFETVLALSVLASDKADHIRANGGPGDGRLSQAWRQASKAIENAARAASVNRVSL